MVAKAVDRHFTYYLMETSSLRTLTLPPKVNTFSIHCCDAGQLISIKETVMHFEVTYASLLPRYGTVTSKSRNELLALDPAKTT
jgi:hypothetical protein